MGSFFEIMNAFFGYLFYPFYDLDPAWGMIWISLVTGIVMLIVFRFTSNQQGIKRAKAKVGAYILEMRLYSHDLAKMLAALGKTLLSNFIYLRYMVVPIIFIIVPVLIVLIQTSFRYEYRPLQPGEQVIVKAILKSPSTVLEPLVTLHVPEGIVIETPAVRIPALSEIDWRIRVDKQGVYELKFEVNGKQYKKNLHTNNKLATLSRTRTGSSFNTYFLNHSEPKLPDDSPFVSLNIWYPARTLEIMGIELNWIVWFFILSLIFSLAFKNIFRVEL